LDCERGKPYWVRCAGSSKDATREDYRCSSAFPGHGPNCGARSIQHEQLDVAIQSLVSKTLCQAPVLRAILSTMAERHPPTEDARGKAVKEIARLDAKRQRIVEMRADGQITRGECAKRLNAVDQELQTAHAAAARPIHYA
jgi:hypothetical protein